MNKFSIQAYSDSTTWFLFSSHTQRTFTGAG